MVSTVADNFSIWDFAGAGANVFRAHIKGRWRDVVGHRPEERRVLDARCPHRKAAVEHARRPRRRSRRHPVGHGGRWQADLRGDRAQPNAASLHAASGETITGGSWAALDPSTGESSGRRDPLTRSAHPDLAALTVANGVLYAGSMAHTGDQMYALNAATGRILWRFPAGGSVVAGPAVVRRNGLLGLRLRADRRRRQRQVLRVQHRRQVAAISISDSRFQI